MNERKTAVCTSLQIAPLYMYNRVQFHNQGFLLSVNPFYC